MRASIATVSLSGSLEEKLQAAASAGFDGVEIFDNDLVASPLDPEGVRLFAADLGLTIELFQPFRDLEGVSEERFRDNLRRAAAKLDIAARLGAPTMLLCSNVATAEIDDDELAAEQLRRLGDIAQERGIKIAYEALAWGTYVSTFEHAWSIARAADHPAIGICLDSFHILARGSSLAPIDDIPGEKIFFAQIADAPLMQMDPLSWSRHHRLFPGQGGLDLVAWTAALARSGYTGPLSIEVFNDVFRQTDPRTTAVDALRSLRFLEDRTSVALGSGTPLSLSRLTESEPVQEFDYVRVMVPVRHTLDAALSAMGFVFQGISGAGDDEWSQGDARLFVTTQGSDESATTGISGVGFALDDVDAMACRAGELLAHRLAPEPGMSSHVIRAPGSLRIGLGARARVATTPADSVAPDVTLRVDHVSLPQDWRTFDEAVLFYRSILGLEVLSSEEVADAQGLVRSQVLVNRSGAVRLVLNVLPPSLVESLSREGLEAPGHIALESSDILSTVRSLEMMNVPMLTLPPNYYEDLAARFDLPSHYLDDLRSLNVMYDRDAEGEFMQAYTQTRANLFFEIVQRIGGYSAFGAANSPVRRAAQRRAGRS